MKKQNIQGLCTKVTKGVMGILEREERGETFKVTKKKNERESDMDEGQKAFTSP